MTESGNVSFMTNYNKKRNPQNEGRAAWGSGRPPLDIDCLRGERSTNLYTCNTVCETCMNRVLFMCNSVVFHAPIT